MPKRRTHGWLLAVTILLTATPAYALQTLFYTTGYGLSFYNAMTWQSVREHSSLINIVAPQVYQLDHQGNISGSIDPKVIAYVKQNSIKLMPLVINQDFSQEIIHQFLNSTAAYTKAIDRIIALCRQHHFYGIQFNLENVSYADKHVLTRFYLQAATALHKAGFKVSFAVVPRFNNTKKSTMGSVFDYTSLANISDFITLMTYDQHTTRTAPGPVASYAWVEDHLRKALRFLPAHKIFLGIPTYSNYWYTGDSTKQKLSAKRLSYLGAHDLLESFRMDMRWNDELKIHHATTQSKYNTRLLYLEDAASFKAKLQLADKYGVAGVAVWRLGIEDPAIWPILGKKSQLNYLAQQRKYYSPTHYSYQVAHPDPEQRVKLVAIE